MQMVDSTVRTVPVANNSINTPYLTGTVEALCPQDAICYPILGNVPGAGAVGDADPEWTDCGIAMTRAGTKAEHQRTPLKVSQSKDWLHVSRSDLIEMQKEDSTIKRLWNRDVPRKG